MNHLYMTKNVIFGHDCPSLVFLLFRVLLTQPQKTADNNQQIMLNVYGLVIFHVINKLHVRDILKK
jgi:hypothetical protein